MRGMREISVALLLAYGLSACSDVETSTPAPRPTTEPTPTTQPACPPGHVAFPRRQEICSGNVCCQGVSDPENPGQDLLRCYSTEESQEESQVVWTVDRLPSSRDGESWCLPRKYFTDEFSGE